MDTTKAERRSARIDFRCLPSEKAALERNATDAGYASLSEFLLARGLAEAARTRKARPTFRTIGKDTLRGLDDLGHSFNSQALAINRGQEYAPGHILENLLALHRLAEADPVLNAMIKDDVPADGMALSPVHYVALSRIANNLNQIAAGLGVGDYPGAGAVREFAAKWTGLVRAEADRQTGLRRS